MGDQLDQSAVKGATSYLRRNRPRYTADVLREKLRKVGYPEAVIDEAFRIVRAERVGHGEPAGSNDLRGPAALILIAAAAAGWGVVALFVSHPLTGLDFSLGIMAVVLGVVVLISLIGVGLSKSLRRGAEGALVTVLVIPLLIVLGITGTCLVISR